MKIKQHDTSLSTDIKTKDGKILHYIRSNSTVLEFGSAYGRMTKFMKEGLNCKVYIVEVDKDAYENAMQYAEGGICADILEFSWLKEFDGITFDHIIFANVLEDLLAPWDVLEKSLSLLKDNGSVLLSVPNIAHNAVLINLLNNKFEYADVGLLDKKHIRFFTHSSLVEMLENCSLVSVVEDGTVCIPENTEFKNSVNDIYRGTEILEQKEYANIYQFVFKCIKKKYYLANKNNINIQKLYGNTTVQSFCSIYFDTGTKFNTNEVIIIPFYIQNNYFEVIVNTNPDCKGIRFDPFEGYACIINNLQITTDNGLINHTFTNGIEINGMFIFDNLDPQIIIDFKGRTNSKVKISGDIYKYHFNDISLISKTKQAIEILITERNGLLAEKEGFINSHSWRITKPLRKFTAFVRRHEMLRLLAKSFLSVKRHGIKKTFKMVNVYKERHSPSLKKNIYLTQNERISQKNTAFPKQVKISIITPIYNTPQRFLIKMIESCLAQTYVNWELCLADGSDKKKKSIERICKSYSIKDKRIKYNKLDRNYGISVNSNKAIEMASGDYFGLLDHDDVLHPSALFEIMKAICNENADFIYTDEATFINNNKIILRHYKPDFAIDTLRSCNYICHFTVFSRKLMERAGTFRSDFDGSQDYDLILRYTDIASKIYHIPKLLYFWRSHGNSVASDIDNKSYAVTSAKNAIMEHLARHGISAQIENTKVNMSYYKIIYELIEHPLVSIIIPNKDHVSTLQNCLSSIKEKTTYSNYEIIIVENNSVEDTTFAYYEELKKQTNIQVVYWEKKGFNYSEINNYGVQYAHGQQLIFLNNDVEIITPNWIEEMLMFNQRNDVGAVGIKLYFPDNTIQHAGVIVGIKGVAGHIYPNVPRDTIGYMGKLHIVQNMSAVTAACMMIKKPIFDEVGKFSPELYASFNDIDLCLRIRTAGYLIVWTPFAEAYHHESKTRGYPDTSEKQLKFTKEIDLFKAKWAKELSAGDPYYNCNFSYDRADYYIN